MKSSLSANGLHLLVTAPFNKSPVIAMPTTLNSKHNVLTNITAASTPPIVQYLGLGVGGTTTDSNGTLDLGLRHRDADMRDLYSSCPLVAVDPANDLTTTEQLDYRMRVVTTVGGIPKVLYYLLNITTHVDSAPSSLMIKTTDDSSTETAYEYGDDDTPVASNGTIFFNATVNIFTLMDSTQVNRLISAIALMYPNNTLSEVTEVGLYSGVDITGGNGRPEASVVQLFSSASQHIPIHPSNNTMTINSRFEIGGL